MKKYIFLTVIFSSTNIFLSQQHTEKKNLIKGKWEFNVFSDSIAFPDIPGIDIKTKNKIFFNSQNFIIFRIDKKKISFLFRCFKRFGKCVCQT